MLIDLTHTLKNGISFFPGSPEPSFQAATTIEKDGFAEISINMPTHTGTHIDAPAHVIAHGKTLDLFPLDKFIGPAVLIDSRGYKSIEKDFLEINEARIKGVDFVLFYTGWQDKWNSPSFFDDFPALSQDAVKYLQGFKLKAVGFDAVSADKIDSAELPNHNLLLADEVLIIENLCNLDKLIDQRFKLYCIPLNIQNADGSPVRAFAELI